MIIQKGSFVFRWLRKSRLYKAEEEFFIRLQQNPVYPFEDIGFGFYYLRVRSDKLFGGIILIIIAVIFITLFTLIVGIFALPAGLFIISLLFGLLMMYGNLTSRELVINREVGYLLRIKANVKILAEHSIHNVYIRLQEKYDTVGMKWYYLILGGYQLDDIRLSRLTQNQSAMRGMGRRLARSLGINYFDYNNTTTRHVVFHYSTYSVRDTFEDHYAELEEEEEEDYHLDDVIDGSDEEVQIENINAAEISYQYEKYMSKQLVSKQLEESEDTKLDELYYNTVIEAGEVIRENVSREEKIEFINEHLKTKQRDSLRKSKS